MSLTVLSERGKGDQLLSLAAIVFFAWFAVILTTPVGEGDYFWHVKTGEWISRHMSLPNSDPFSFTVQDVNPFNPGSKRIPFLLKQYWLGQLVFYWLWKAFGEAGMVVLRSACYTGILLLLYSWARQMGSGLAPLLAVIAVGNVLRNYSNERPQIFAYLLMPLLLIALERLRKLRGDNPGRLTAISLPLIMLVWSNCHGSFILGIVVIVLYLAGSLIDRARLGERLNLPVLCTMLGAILASLVNPNVFGAFREMLSLSKAYTDQVAEFISPLLLAWKFHAIDYYYWLVLSATVIFLIASLRRVVTHHLLVIVALAGLSLTATRYIPFFMLSVPLLCPYLPAWQPKRLFRFAPVLLVLLLVATADYRNVLKFRAERAFPAQAVRFLNEARPAGNMFNYIGWGGYLMCYSGYPVFIDGRTLVEEFFTLHNNVLAGRDWQGILDRYDINFMIIPGTDTISLQAYPLLLHLLTNDDWALVYHDDVALVLLRTAAENTAIIRRHAVDKSAMTAHIQARWRWQMANDF